MRNIQAWWNTRMWLVFAWLENQLQDVSEVRDDGTN